MSGIDKPGRWRLGVWSEERWFDAYDYCGTCWHGLNESGKYDGWRGDSSEWAYIGPLPDSTPATISDEQKVQWFIEMVKAGRVEVLIIRNRWILLPAKTDYRLVPPQQTTAMLRGPASPIGATEATPGVEVVNGE